MGEPVYKAERARAALPVIGIWYGAAVLLFSIVYAALPDVCPGTSGKGSCGGFTPQGGMGFIGFVFALPATLVTTAISGLLLFLLVRVRSLPPIVIGCLCGALGAAPILLVAGTGPFL